ncbi:amidohydrolase [Pelosinus propionicus]|uniref:Peptidase M20 domain-containing protein 2 n=1 Tax=Pelosinus propionicus DSM 13327 TaxID=1123291 RepID=A0A1I4PPQ3_9FIRM|nr:amidohydrolase [Pelosinus propionicus]SFM29757.1 amidohydrolase [Pelosinus propionicus DSM 13327]
MKKEELKQKICQAIEANKEQIFALGESIYKEPELGFKETKTASKVEEIFRELGISYEKGLALTGVKGRIKGKKSNRTVAILGELDAVTCAAHPGADPLSGAAHCCGHNVQIAMLMAVGRALLETGAMEYLAGDVVLFAVPAEEYVEISYRNKLREEGKITYLGGKQELIHLGAFDDIDMALQIHLLTNTEKDSFIRLGSTSNGFIGKLVKYRGKAAHAAMAPSEGINALNAAMLGIMGVNAQRETFREEDYVRFHPIITQGGDLVNVIPEDVRMESYVRAATMEALQESNKKIDRALRAGGDAVGAEVSIQSLPGYLPMYNNQDLNQVFRGNAEVLYGPSQVVDGAHEAGSTDTGDLSHIMPTIHPWLACVSGALHSKEYVVADVHTAYIKSAQALAMTIIDLLYGDGEAAENILHDYKPLLTKEKYVEFLNSFNQAN